MMVKEGLDMAPDHLTEEYNEVVHEIEGERVFSCSADALEAQSPITTTESHNTTELLAARINGLFGGALNPVAVQVFSMVFLAEWGDRSQLATIVLAAAQNPWGVALGASSGHAVCSLIAVLVGRAMSSVLSIKTVTICGGLLFVIFSVLTVL
jgi:putative Ca2+/H+ antiporter (TMEM165/GDT1 family)